MFFRLATKEDLPKIRETFHRLRRRMDADGISIWTKEYPTVPFENDIDLGRLYLLMSDGGELLAASALCAEAVGDAAAHFRWSKPEGNAVYIYRLGVSPDHPRQGIGSVLMENLKAAARALGADFLRVFVVDINRHAHPFYQKNGFIRVAGEYKDPVLPGRILTEYGYEVKL